LSRRRHAAYGRAHQASGAHKRPSEAQIFGGKINHAYYSFLQRWNAELSKTSTSVWRGGSTARDKNTMPPIKTASPRITMTDWRDPMTRSFSNLFPIIALRLL
jgi:hypothetical protein